jgi:hypothetical protein
MRTHSDVASTGCIAHGYQDTWLLPVVMYQGDDMAHGLSEGSLLKGDNLCVLRLLGCGLTDEAACRLAKVLESVGEN